MTWLALNTTTDRLDLCLGKKEISKEQWILKSIPCARRYAQDLIPLTINFLDTHFVSFKDLSGLVVCTGPGSFTGIRIGLAAAQGWSLALNIPCFGVSAFEYIAHTVSSSKNSLLIMIPTEESEDAFYVQALTKGLVPIPGPFKTPKLWEKGIFDKEDKESYSLVQGDHKSAEALLETSFFMQEKKMECHFQPLYARPSYVKE